MSCTVCSELTSFAWITVALLAVWLFVFCTQLFDEYDSSARRAVTQLCWRDRSLRFFGNSPLLRRGSKGLTVLCLGRPSRMKRNDRVTYYHLGMQAPYMALWKGGGFYQALVVHVFGVQALTSWIQSLIPGQQASHNFIFGAGSHLTCLPSAASVPCIHLRFRHQLTNISTIVFL